MTLYHGSTIVIPTPQILTPSHLLDFGEGFYTTSNFDQAIRWSNKVAEQKKTNTIIISVYEFDKETAKKNLKIHEFSSPTGEWLRFVTSCRSGKNTGLEYDIAIGPVANDTVYTTVQLFETGIFDEEEAIRRLKVAELFDQYLFHTVKSLEYLQYVDHIEKEATYGK
jgi:hypothetical protein